MCKNILENEVFGSCYEFSKEIKCWKNKKKIRKFEEIMGKIEILISIALMTNRERVVCSKERFHEFRGVARFSR